MQQFLLSGNPGANGLIVRQRVEMGPGSGLVRAVNQLLGAMLNVSGIQRRLKTATHPGVQVNFYILNFSFGFFHPLPHFYYVYIATHTCLMNMFIPLKGLTESGKNGEPGPTATSLAPTAEKSEPEPAKLPCLEATTVLVNELRRSRALLAAAPTLCRASELWSLLINHLAKTPPVQVSFWFLYCF